MTNVLFHTEELEKCWIDCTGILKSYFQNIIDYKFDLAGQSTEKLIKFVNDYENLNSIGHPDKFYNDCFIFKEYANLLSSYAQYWSQICSNKYEQSWDTLQDILDSLRNIKKFTLFDKTILFKFLEKQALGLEKLYPYRFFASTEIVVSQIECSICGKNINSNECNHIKGELYRGKMAYGIVKEIKDCLAIALVENPADKRCKMQSLDGKPFKFPCVEYLTKLILTQKINPLYISHAEETIHRIPIKDSKIGRNEICPCGSGKKLKKCCINKEFAQKNHIEIILKKDGILTSNDLISLN
ncbi:MAG: SEC-C metal-binding domain-containing protein [Phycisphaerales bacterium]